MPQMLSNYRRDRSLLGSGGVSGSYNHPAGVAKAINGFLLRGDEGGRVRRYAYSMIFTQVVCNSSD